MLYGRAREQGEIDRLITAARSGRSGALVLRGEAGIGKSALLDYAAEVADDHTVLRALAVEFEAQLPFAALHLLLQPVLDHIDRLPHAQAEALRAAFALGPATVRDRFLVGLAALTLLSDLGDEGPVVCLIDDAQWLDKSSADALLFAARRLEAEGVVMVFSVRDGTQDGTQPLPVSGVPQLRLGGLSDQAADALLTKHAGDLAPQVHQRILDDAVGNPLALLELSAALDPEQRSGRLAPLSFAVGVGPGSDRVRQTFQAQIGRLPESTQAVLLVAAADDTGDLGLILRAAERLGGTLAAVEPAERAGLVRLSATRLDFRHPLVRSAAYQLAAHVQRMTAHRSLACVMDEVAHADRRAWHLATATVGPDEQVAAELERAAVRAKERQGAATASAAYERAAELGVGERRRADRLISAAELAVQAGQWRRAPGLTERIIGPSADDPAIRARLDHVAGSVASEQGTPGKAGRILIEGARLANDPSWATRMLVDAVRNASAGGDPELVCDADAALSALGDSPLARGMCTVARVVGDEAVGDLAPIHAAIRFLRSAPDDAWDRRLLAASLGLLAGDEATAVEVSTAQVTYCRERGMIGVLPDSTRTAGTGADGQQPAR